MSKTRVSAFACMLPFVFACSSSSSAPPSTSSSSIIGSCPVVGSYSVTTTTIDQGTCGNVGHANSYQVTIGDGGMPVISDDGELTDPSTASFDSSTCTLTAQWTKAINLSSCSGNETAQFSVKFDANGFTGQRVDNGQRCVNGATACTATYSITGTRD